MTAILWYSLLLTMILETQDSFWNVGSFIQCGCAWLPKRNSLHIITENLSFLCYLWQYNQFVLKCTEKIPTDYGYVFEIRITLSCRHEHWCYAQSLSFNGECGEPYCDTILCHKHCTKSFHAGGISLVKACISGYRQLALVTAQEQ
jgi:hypothetical protein